MKQWDKTPEKELKMETNNLPEAEFKIWLKDVQ